MQIRFVKMNDPKNSVLISMNCSSSLCAIFLVIIPFRERLSSQQSLNAMQMPSAEMPYPFHEDTSSLLTVTRKFDKIL